MQHSEFCPSPSVFNVEPQNLVKSEAKGGGFMTRSAVVIGDLSITSPGNCQMGRRLTRETRPDASSPGAEDLFVEETSKMESCTSLTFVHCHASRRRRDAKEHRWKCLQPTEGVNGKYLHSNLDRALKQITNAKNGYRFTNGPQRNQSSTLLCHLLQSIFTSGRSSLEYFWN